MKNIGQRVNDMVQLEKYKGSKSRYTCPDCNSRGVFVRYVADDGSYLSETVGRCNRESKCGYHYKPKQFYADNPKAKEIGVKSGKGKKQRRVNYTFTDKNVLQRTEYQQNAFDFIPNEHLKRTLGNYTQNGFIQFLLNLFPACREELQNVLAAYSVGTFLDYQGCYTCFPYIDRLNRVCKTKLIRFEFETGRRLKGDYDTSSLSAKLNLNRDYKQIFFGEHILNKYPDKPVAIVEAEKTVVVASLCYPEYNWLASGSKQWLNAERLQRFGNKQVLLFPDADGFEKWQTIATNARRSGLNVKVSTLIESHATNEQKADGYDLADYLIERQIERLQIERLQTNNFIDKYNARLETVLNDKSLFADFNSILDEQKAILVYNGLSEIEAETQITKVENLRNVVLSVRKKGDETK